MHLIRRLYVPCLYDAAFSQTVYLILKGWVSFCFNCQTCLTKLVAVLFSVYQNEFLWEYNLVLKDYISPLYILYSCEPSVCTLALPTIPFSRQFTPNGHHRDLQLHVLWLFLALWLPLMVFALYTLKRRSASDKNS